MKTLGIIGGLGLKARSIITGESSPFIESAPAMAVIRSSSSTALI